MCGLVGLICKSTYGFNTADRDVFKQMLFADTLRGSDATGAFAVNKYGNIRGVKQAIAAPWFINSAKYTEFEKDMLFDIFLVGHNRKATHGDKTNTQNAHPFLVDPIILVHNGMISNHGELGAEKADVDSLSVANSLAKNGVVETLKKVEGAYTFIWYNIDEKKLYFIRNEQRPLAILETANGYALSSEPGLGFWVLSRNNQKVDNVKAVEPSTLYSVSLDNPKEIHEEKLDLTKPPKPMVYGWDTAAATTYYPPRRERIPVVTKHNLSAEDLKALEPMFFTSEDITSFGVINLFRPKDEVLFVCDDVEEFMIDITDDLLPKRQAKRYRVKGHVANLNEGSRVNVVGVAVNNPQIPGSAWENQTLVGKVTSIRNKGTDGIPLLHVDSIDQRYTEKTGDGYYLSYMMYKSTYVDSICPECGENISFNSIGTATVDHCETDNKMTLTHSKCKNQSDVADLGEVYGGYCG